ncbi:DUF1367 family protein [Pantoea coffeiphila]|nr:DUF1367 family protein [Pantoea coffeiphila]
MKVEMIKLPGGSLHPVNERELERMTRFANGTQHSVDIKLARNPSFHRKVFAFFNFCFEYWCAENSGLAFLDEAAQFDTFRRQLTVLAGYYVKTYKFDGSVRIEAKSLSYGDMDQDEFEQCYSALINAAIKHLFGNTSDPRVLNQLRSFF